MGHSAHVTSQGEKFLGGVRKQVTLRESRPKTTGGWRMAGDTGRHDYGWHQSLCSLYPEAPTPSVRLGLVSK